MELRYNDRYESENPHSSCYNESSHEVLIITIDIGDGRKEELTVRDTDDATFVASAFCAKHRLGLNARESLISQIQQNFSNSSASVLNPHNQSFDSENSRQSFISGKSFKENVFSNIGEKLYRKGLKFIEKSENKKKQIIEDQIYKEKSQNTFKPKINSNKEKSAAVEDELIQKGREMIENIERKREMIAAKEMSQCTFSPSIGFVSSDSLHMDRCLKLYENARVAKNKIQVVNEKLKKQECPFEPDTRVSRRVSEKIVQGSMNRAKISSSRKAIEDYLKEINSNKDPKTGQELFKPVVGRPPKFRKVDSQNIGDHLYAQRSHSQCSKSSSQVISKTLPNQSNKILNRIKDLRFQQLFLDLEPNNSDQITPESIQRCRLSPKTLKILDPLLSELKSLNEKLNFSEFCESMEILMKTLTPDQKSSLLKTSKARSDPEPNNFKPKINPGPRPATEESLYERNLKKMIWVKEKCELEKKRQEESMLAQCTFKPKITKYSHEVEESCETLAFEPFRPLSESFYF